MTYSRLLSVENMPATMDFNYAVHHSGLLQWRDFAIRNCGEVPTKAVFLKSEWSAFARSHFIAVPTLLPGELYACGEQLIPLLDIEDLGQLPERQDVFWDISFENVLIHRSSMHVLAAQEWSWLRGWEASLAAFVQPNAPAISEIVTAARLTHGAGFQKTFEIGMQQISKGEPAHAWTESVHTLYESIRSRYRWIYEYEPASFETESQKVRIPEEVSRYLEGTCLDLAVAFASCLERVYLQPILIILRRGQTQHAIVGWRIREPLQRSPVFYEATELMSMIPEQIDVVECTGLAEVVGTFRPVDRTNFKNAVTAARRTLKEWELWCAVDVRAARMQLGITPLPLVGRSREPLASALRSFLEANGLPIGFGDDLIMNSSRFTERTGFILYQAIQEATNGGTGTLTLQHLVLALLAKPSGAAERMIRSVGGNPELIRGRLIHLSRIALPRTPRVVTLTKAVYRVLERLCSSAWATGMQVTEAALLLEVLRQKDSETIRMLAKDLETTPAYLLEMAESLFRSQRPETPPLPDSVPGV